MFLFPLSVSVSAATDAERTQEFHDGQLRPAPDWSGIGLAEIPQNDGFANTFFSQFVTTRVLVGEAAIRCWVDA